MGELILFFVFLIVSLAGFVYVMAPIADGWLVRQLAARAECEAIRKRLRAQDVESDT